MNNFAELPYILKVKYELNFLQMELAKKFDEVTSCHSVNLRYLEMNTKCPIVRAKRICSKYGPTVY